MSYDDDDDDDDDDDNNNLRTCRSISSFLFSGGASAAKEPGHSEVRTSSNQVDDFLVVAFKTQRPPTPLRLFHCQNKTDKAVSGQIR